ncbi:hypothetical protein CH063_02978 [Colletotrichum higginsianum]|uniref:Uncharacterized protein n=1 Tax=Colletotrichum higginsianum (strain IMI 349063) TaxID=759273 RepID=H1VS31_COLHI|nr:hypothetical protein CH63R_01024 [Colletotrichum higginsianum IMI 349063]OBR15844.1 hypothetical protein CH63R_01024 [Colletotrichum higginsianum IMI 349063]CCF43038.1 hypothetical protein CH063_02978 [Colletotrichum higginsianum]
MDNKIVTQGMKQLQQHKKTNSHTDCEGKLGVWMKQRLCHQWAPSQGCYVECRGCNKVAVDHCEKHAVDQVTHQACVECLVAICRDCVVAGHMDLIPDHPQKTVDELEWKRPSVTVANDPNHVPTKTNNIASSTGLDAQRTPVVATPVRQMPASLAGSSSTVNNTCGSTTSSSHKFKGKTTPALTGSSGGPKEIQVPPPLHHTRTPIHLWPETDYSPSFLFGTIQTTPTSNKLSALTLSTPTKKSKRPSKKVIVISESGSDPDYEMDPSSTGSSDKEYVPRADLSCKPSANSLSLEKDDGETAEPIGTPVKNTPIISVGLAKSRPVRTAAIQTYEKMRLANSKKQRDAEELGDIFDEAQNTKPGLKMAGSVQNAPVTTDVSSVTRDAKNFDFVQKGAVYGGNAYLHGPEYAQQVGGYDAMSLPELHPGAGSKGQWKATESLAAAGPADDKKRAVAVSVEEAPAAKRQNTSTQSFIPASKAELAAASTNAIKEAEASIRSASHQITPAERDANRVFVTADLEGLAAAIENKVRLRVLLTGPCTVQDIEIELRNAIHGAWVSNMALTRIKRTDGDVAAMQLLRGYANLVMMRLKIKGTGLLKNWIDATEKDMQDKAAYVPDELRIETIKPVSQQGLNYKIGETDVQMANILVHMKNSTC